MGDTQLAPSSPSSGLSNGTKRLREGSTENGQYSNQASSSAVKLDSSGKQQTPTSSQRKKVNGTTSASSSSRSNDEGNHAGLTNGRLRVEEEEGKDFASISNGTLNRLKDSQMRNSAPPSSSLSQLTSTKSTKRSARTSDLESEVSQQSNQPKSQLERMRSIRQTRSTSPLFTPQNESSQLSASNVNVENLALNQKEQNLFRVKASDESSQVLPSPPRLPFDAEYPGLATNGLDPKGNPIPIIRREEIAKQLVQMNNRDRNAKQSPIREIKVEVDQQSTPFDTNSRASSAIVREMDDRDSSAVGNEDMRVDVEHSNATLNEAKGSLPFASAEEGNGDSIARISTSEDVDEDANNSIIGENGLINGSSSTPIKSSSSARSNRRKRQSEVEVLDQSFNDISAADLSIDSINSASSRRPREAHKRLKMIGGYYGKNAKPPSPPDSLAERTEEVNDQINAQSTLDESQNGSRAASSTLDEVGPVPLTATTAVTTADEDLLAQAIAADASFTTPIKASQQSTMTINLRNSASKNQSTKMIHAGSGLIDNGGENNEHCETCNGAGHFICCDGCPRSFHFACINPPMDIDELPGTMGDEEDKWYCNVCKAEKESIKSEAQSNGKNSGSKSKEKAKVNSNNGKGATRFQPLFTYVERTNPTIFALPLEIRNYFKGVATANDGSYVDSNMLRPLKINRLGVVEERDPLRLKDKNGKLILCFRCGESALPSDRPTGKGRRTNQPRRSSPRKAASNDQQQKSQDKLDADHIGWRKIISCDFCSLHWHLDCLEPPMASMPSLSRKWMCPAHVDHAVRPERIPKSIANSTTLHELPIPSEKSVGPGKHYRTRVVNDGRIDIIPDPMDTYFVAPQNGQNDKSGKQQDEKNMHSLAASVSGSGDQRGRGFDKGWEDLDIPNTATSLASNSSQKTNNGSSSKNLKFKYRIPEKVIRLDFWSKAEIERERAFSRFLQHIHEDAHKPLDVLATIANAEFLGPSASDHNINEAEGKIDAKRSVEQIFGSQYARTLFPSLDVSTELAKDEESKIDGERESGIRQTFISGEYEKEFNERSLAMITPTLTPSAAVTELTEQMREAKVAANRLNVEESALAMNVDVEELSKLRAIKVLVDRKGAKALLDFLLTEEERKED